MENSKHVVFTSVNFNYLGRALVLARSVKRNDPKVHFVLLVVEPNFAFSELTKELLLSFDSGNTFNEILTLDDLELKNNNEFSRYTVVEMCTAVKGQTTVQLLNRDDSQFVTYLDPDLFFYRPLSDIRLEHKNGDVLLTPHLNHIPFLNTIIFNDEIAGMMRHGVYNLGFISFSNTKKGRDIADWWAERLLISSKADYERGLFTDQKWWDLSQVYFEDTKVVKNDGWNMAPWNVSERRLVSIEPPILDNGEPLLFFHFSKFPSKEFDEKIRAQSISSHLNLLIREYDKAFSEAQIYVKTNIKSILDSKISSEYAKVLEPKRSQKVEILLSNILIRLTENRIMRRIASKSIQLKKIARYLYSALYSQIYRTTLTDQVCFAGPAPENLVLDLLLVTHKGGGGVAEIIKKRVLQETTQGKSVGVLKPNPKGEITLVLGNSIYSYKMPEDIRGVINRSGAIEIHHILGLEEYLGLFSTKRIETIVLHDKYLLSQLPFSDTLNYISVKGEIPGVNVGLNPKFKVSDDQWKNMTGKLLFNSDNITAPSEYLINSYHSAFPEIKIEKINFEPRFEPAVLETASKKKETFLLISPTGVHKGSSVVSEIAGNLLSQNPRILFRIFGDLEIETQNRLEKFSNVQLTGQISRARLNHALSNSKGTIGWIPSLTGESYSLALSDLLSNGIRVVATNCGALPERIRAIPGNYLYDPATPTQILTEILVAISDNSSLESFNQYVEST